MAFFEFLFPLFAFAAGGFLIFRGARKLDDSKTHSGIALSDSPFVSPLSGEKCVYLKLVMECYSGGPAGWQKLAEQETRPAFRVGESLVVPGSADFNLSPHVHEGLVKRELGTLEEFGQRMGVRGGFKSAVAPLLGISPYHPDVLSEEPLPDHIVDSLRSLEKFRKPLEANLKKTLRVSEYRIEQGGAVHLAGGRTDGKTIYGDVDARLIVTDAGEETARSTQKERGFLGILVGAFLLGLSATLFYLILSSA